MTSKKTGWNIPDPALTELTTLRGAPSRKPQKNDKTPCKIGRYKMKKTVLAFVQPLAAVLLTVFLSCATTGNGGESAGDGTGTAETGIRAAPVEDNAVYEGDGLSLAEAIEQSAEKIAADLPAGSRVAFAAWESPNLGLSDYIMEELTGALVDRGMEVADRQNLEYVYRELDFQMSEVVSDESARSIGKFLGADLVITGQLMELGGPYRYRANAINVESATRDSVTRLDVRGDAAMRRMVAALANQKTAVKVSSYGVSEKTVPKTAGAFLDRGITLASQGEYESAIADFTQAIQIDPNLAAAYNNRGNAYYNKKDYDRAIADYTQAIRLDPNDPDRYYNRGNAYNKKGDYDRAIADYTQAIRLDPNYAYAYNGRGIAYYNKRDYDRAIADYTQAIRINPNHAAAYVNRGHAYYDKEDYDRAIADYTQGIRIDPINANESHQLANAYNHRGYAYKAQRDYDQAIADFTQVMRFTPDEVYIYITRGMAYYDKGDYDQAIADFTQALQIDPKGSSYVYNEHGNFISAYNARGDAYYDRKDYDRAIADFTAAIRLNPTDGRAYNLRGNAYLGKGDRTRARADWSKALELDPNDTASRNNLENFK
jgi:tetratricopeptide (TPR) repeat protein